MPMRIKGDLKISARYKVNLKMRTRLCGRAVVATIKVEYAIELLECQAQLVVKRIWTTLLTGAG